MAYRGSDPPGTVSSNPSPSTGGSANHRFLGGFCRRSTIEPGSSTARSVKLGRTRSNVQITVLGSNLAQMSIGRSLKRGGADRTDFGGSIRLAIASEEGIESCRSRIYDARAVKLGFDCLRSYLLGLRSPSASISSGCEPRSPVFTLHNLRL